MYIYHALIDVLSADMIHININTICYTHAEHSPTNAIYIKVYEAKNVIAMNSNCLYIHDTDLHAHAHTHTHSHTHTHTHTHTTDESLSNDDNMREDLCICLTLVTFLPQTSLNRKSNEPWTVNQNFYF